MNNLTSTKVLLDSNAIIYYINGQSSVDHIVENNFLFASIISEIEVLGFNLNNQQIDYFETFFEDVSILPITNDIKNKAIFFKRNYNLKTADSIIAATAFSLNLPLISADKIFNRVQEIQFFQILVS